MSRVFAGSRKATVEELLDEWDIEVRGAFVRGRHAMDLLSLLCKGCHINHTYLNEYPTSVAILLLLETCNTICASLREDILDPCFPRN